jgi:hypothetical protein
VENGIYVPPAGCAPLFSRLSPHACGVYRVCARRGAGGRLICYFAFRISFCALTSCVFPSPKTHRVERERRIRRRKLWQSTHDRTPRSLSFFFFGGKSPRSCELREDFTSLCQPFAHISRWRGRMLRRVATESCSSGARTDPMRL